MSNPHHGEDVIDRDDTTGEANYGKDDTAPMNGYYVAYRRHPRKKLGGKDFHAGEKFDCWPSPEVCDVVWIGPC